MFQGRKIESLLVVILMTAGGVSWTEPSVELVLPESGPRVNEAYTVSCRVTWPRAEENYVILPAQIVEDVDWGEVSLRRVRAEVEGDRNVVTQEIEIVPHREGDVETPTIEIAYTSPETQTPTDATVHAGTVPPDSSVPPALRVLPTPLYVRRSSPLLWIPVSLGALPFLALAFWWYRYKRRPASPAPGAGPVVPPHSIRTCLSDAKRHRVEGNLYEYYQSLCQAAGLFPETPDAVRLGERLRARAREVGYGGERPTDDELTLDFKEVERGLTRIEEHEEH